MEKLHGERRGSRGHSFHGHALLLWAIDEVERIDDLAELARTIREYYVGHPSLPDLLRRIDDRAGELLSGRPRANVMRVRLEP